MNSQSECCEAACKKCGACAYIVAALGSFLIVAGLVWTMYHYTHPQPLESDRAAVRSKALSELRAANADVLDTPNFVWQDQTKGIVRLPIKSAMDLALKLWQNPTSARSNLTARVEKATFVPPPQSFE